MSSLSKCLMTSFIFMLSNDASISRSPVVISWLRLLILIVSEIWFWLRFFWTNSEVAIVQLAYCWIKFIPTLSMLVSAGRWLHRIVALSMRGVNIVATFWLMMISSCNCVVTSSLFLMIRKINLFAWTDKRMHLA